MRTPGYYLHIAPGVLSFDVRLPVLVAYVWGLSAGRFIPRRDRLAIAVGGFFEHLILPVHNVHSARLHRPRIGAELRVGASGARVFGYGLARLGLDLLFGEPGGFGGADAVITLGGGVQGALGPRGRLLIGAEPAFDVSAPNLWLMARARVFVGVRF